MSYEHPKRQWPTTPPLPKPKFKVSLVSILVLLAGAGGFYFAEISGWLAPERNNVQEQGR